MAGPHRPGGPRRSLPSGRTFALAGALGALSLGIPLAPRVHDAATDPGGTTPPRLEQRDRTAAEGSAAPATAPEVRTEVRELRPGSTLGTLLEDVLDGRELRRLSDAMAPHTSPSRLRAGTRITLEYRTGGLGVASGPGDTASHRALVGLDSLTAVEIGLDRDRSLRLEPLRSTDGGWRTALREVRTRPDTFYVSGRIDGSLWDAIDRHPVLQGRTAQDRWLVVDRMDRVYQWQVDFSRQLQPGDRFRLAIETEVRPDGSFKDGRVLAAELVNAGTRLAATWFDPDGDGEGDYFDENGESLRRAFLKKPLEFRRISSRFNPNRLHPILGTRRPHRGVDYAAARGTPIMATGDAVVTHRGPKGGLGNAVILRHANGFVTRYAHMSRFADGVRAGGRVRQGQVIGYVGSTGLASGPHLHYEMWRDGRVLDPLEVELPAGDPVPDAVRVRFGRESRARMALLDRIGSGPPVTRMAGGAASSRSSGASEPAPPSDRPRQDGP